ncbi:MAG: hypothetical protein AAGD33_16040 [Actinomycetota bacterium]
MTVASWWSPATDAGVVVQFIVTVVIGSSVAALLLRRGEREVAWLAVGITTLLVGWYGLRGLH